jgi:choline kinase
MDAVIVAAGRGTRMENLTQDTHKCLLPVDGRPIIEYSLKTLKAHGIRRIFMVTGHFDAQVRQTLGRWVFKFVENPFYRTTNNMASLWFAREHVEEDFLYMHSDLLYHPKIMTDFLNHPFSHAAICMEEKETFLGEEMKIGREEDRLILGKELPDERCIGEFIGIAAFRKDGFASFADVMTNILMSGNHNTYFAEAVALASKANHFELAPFTGLPWIEVDTANDLKRAESAIMPKILEMGGKWAGD